MYASAILLSALATLTIATPHLNRRQSVVTMTFTGGPASYTMTFPSNGETFLTNNVLGVSQISATGISDIASSCTIIPWEGGEFVTNVDGSLTLGPPGPIKSVSCTSDTCVPVYGDCEVQLPNNGGIELLACCPGAYCAATKCRSMTA